jgi:hypothetical protein
MPQNSDLFVLYRQGDAEPHKKLSWAGLLEGISGIVPPEKGDPTNVVHVGETPPEAPHEGDLWFKPNSDAVNDGVLYLYYVTPTTGVVSSVSIRGGGSGYTVKNNVAVLGGDGHELRVDITSVGQGGSITGVEVADGGHGYETSNVGFLFNDGHANASVMVTSVSSVPDGDWIVLVDSRRSRVPTMGSPPSNPRNGELYWDVNNANMYIYYDDGITAQWVPAFTSFSGNVAVNDIDGGQYNPDLPGTIDPAALNGGIYNPDQLDPNAETINGGAF